MNNKGIFIVVTSSVIVVIISILYVFSLRKFDNKILNNKWYHYDAKTGYSDIIHLKKDELYIYRPSSDNKTDEYTYCSSYKYNKSTKKITLDCGKIINIRMINSSKIKVNINNDEYFYFKTLNESRNYEFKQLYGIYPYEYNNTKNATLDVIKVDKEKLSEIINDTDYSKVIFIGNNCKSVECTLTNEIIEKWISFSKNVYYIDANTLDEQTLNGLNKKDLSFSTDTNDYNNVYPLVYVFSGGKIIDRYEITCSGFNCASYFNK